MIQIQQQYILLYSPTSKDLFKFEIKEHFLSPVDQNKRVN
jgi:hypothetical protein